jgi:hypothetical protein
VGGGGGYGAPYMKLPKHFEMDIGIVNSSGQVYYNE